MHICAALILPTTHALGRMSVVAPPGVKSKKQFIISNAPSTVEAGASKGRNMTNSDFRTLLSQSHEGNAHDEEDHEEVQKERMAKKKNAKAKSYERWQARKAQLEQKVTCVSVCLHHTTPHSSPCLSP